MAQSVNDSDGAGSAQGQFEYDQTDNVRQAQRRINLQIRSAEAQKAVAKAMEKNAFYMLLSVIIATASTIVAAAAAIYSVVANVPHVPH